MSYNYLDKTGLASVWAKIKAALATKANSADLADIAISGSYEDLNDMPEILTTNDDVVTEDQVPYLFRKSTDSDRAVEEIVGGTVGWNQLFSNGNMEDVTKWGTQSNATINGMTNNVMDVSFSSDNNSQVSSGGLHLTNGHKFLTTVKVKLPNTSSELKLLGGFSVSVAETKATTDWQTVATVTGATTYEFWILRNVSGVAIDNVLVREAQIFDLTTMLGTTIADYIYSLEQSTAGAGVAKLKEWGFFTEDYYEYCEPTLKSVEGLVSKKTVGWNQWDEEWEAGGYVNATGLPYETTDRIRSKPENYIRICPNTTYFSKCGSNINFYFYDENKEFISYNVANSNVLFTTPQNAKYMRFFVNPSYGTTYNHDICINLSDPTRNGQYEPYESHSYPLDSTLTLRGIPKLDSNNNLYFDGDIYPADGNGSRRYGVVVLNGTENWVGSAENGYYIDLDSLKKISNVGGYVGHMLADKIPIGTWTEEGTLHGYNDSTNRYPNKNWLYYFNQTLSSASDVKSYFASNPVTVVYELATPTTFTATPYHNPQIVGDTEEWVTTGIVPVGHSTKYHTSYYTTNDYIKEKGYLTEKDILGKVNTSDLATVATSGSYNDLDDKPTIPTNEIFVGSTTPSGYTLYIDPEGSLSNGEGVSF